MPESFTQDELNHAVLSATLNGSWAALITVPPTDKQLAQVTTRWIALVEQQLGSSADTKEWVCYVMDMLLRTMKEDAEPEVQRLVRQIERLGKKTIPIKDGQHRTGGQ